ncbi:MAG TPA: alpha-L-fucosidase, partial [Bacteroidales bacterium]
MKKTILILIIALGFQQLIYAQTSYQSPVRPTNEPIDSGKFVPTWQSLQQYKVPEWFRNAKFGI